MLKIKIKGKSKEILSTSINFYILFLYLLKKIYILLQIILRLTLIITKRTYTYVSFHLNDVFMC